jgi:Phosphomannomutase
MAEHNAVYAFELSGHHFFREFYNSEAGIYPALLLIKLLKSSGKTLSELAKQHIVYYHSTEINSEITQTPEQIYEALREKYSDAAFETIDGLTISYPDWWCNVRPSANDPVMRLNLEAGTEAVMSEKRDEVLEIIRANER